MAQGQAHFEQSFQNLQQAITDLGTGLNSKLQSLISAHDSGNEEEFESHANALDELVNRVQNLGQADNQATTSGASPHSGTDLPQTTPATSSAPGGGNAPTAGPETPTPEPG